MEQSKLLEYLQDCPWKEQLVLLETAESTNVTAQQLADGGAPHGTVVLAEHQTAGKGRMGRSFSSPRGLGIYCSVVLRFSKAPSELMHLTAVAAEAVRRAIVQTTGLAPQIKWVNDLVLDGRKLCGILTQLQTGAANETVVILGIGINCRQQPDDFPEELRQIATSLEQGLRRLVDREAVTAELLRQLCAAVDDAPGAWLDSYRQHCVTLGQDVQLVQGDIRRQAHADAMDDQGALLVTLPDGSRERVFSGEVSVRGIYGYV